MFSFINNKDIDAHNKKLAEVTQQRDDYAADYAKLQEELRLAKQAHDRNIEQMNYDARKKQAEDEYIKERQDIIVADQLSDTEKRAFREAEKSYEEELAKLTELLEATKNTITERDKEIAELKQASILDKNALISEKDIKIKELNAKLELREKIWDEQFKEANKQAEERIKFAEEMTTKYIKQCELSNKAEVAEMKAKALRESAEEYATAMNKIAEEKEGAAQGIHTMYVRAITEITDMLKSVGKDDSKLLAGIASIISSLPDVKQNATATASLKK